MPWQRQVLDVALEVELDAASGLWIPAYREVRVTVPRQSGKTTLLVVKNSFRMLAWPNARKQNISYTAQSRQDAREKWEEHVELLGDTILAPLFKARWSNGSERMTWKGGHRWNVAGGRRGKAGHGKTLDGIDLDEFFAQHDWSLEQGARPAMTTRADAQQWVLSTMGDDTSVPLNAKVEDGRARVEADLRNGVAYFEWSAADDLDPADPATWWTCMPALGITQTEATIRTEYDTLKDQPGEFERAYLNRRTRVSETVIPLSSWGACIDETPPPATLQHGPEVHLSIDVAEDRSSAAIAAASLVDGDRILIEVTDHRPGTRWLVPRLLELERKHRPHSIIVDAGGPARSKVFDLEDKLPDPGVLRKIGAAEVAAAAGDFFEAVLQGGLVHVDQPELNLAVAGAAKRTLLDTWAWSRRSSAVDISPLVAVTHAYWGARTPPIRGGFH